ncbi:MAG TPA: hypothetical protein VFH99_02605 [Candidatus Saccharimonadales bacterium]|nr:hypothetical protein [Candidatus Saccharimonadales bacterium]
MNPYEKLQLEPQPGVILEEPIDYGLDDAQLQALPPDARVAVVVVSEAMQRTFDSHEDINNLLAAETGFDDETLRGALTSLRGHRGLEGMRIDRTDGLRLLLTATGLEKLNKQVEKIKSETDGKDSS